MDQAHYIHVGTTGRYVDFVGVTLQGYPGRTTSKLSASDQSPFTFHIGAAGHELISQLLRTHG